MEFLGNLGIDIKLLIAQMVNFGILLWLLSRFVYRPIIKRIEKDESELERAQIQKKELEQQKEAFEEKENKEIAKTKRRVQEIIEEANDMAEEIKKRSKEETGKEASAIIRQSKDKLESLKPEIKKTILKEIQTKIGNSFQESFLSALSLPSQKEFQNILWRDFIEHVQRTPLEKLKGVDVAGMMEKGVEKKLLEKELKKILAQKANRVVLEYMHPLTIRQEEELEKIISEKSGMKLPIVKKQNEKLINGFRLEIAGMIIEDNLLNIINYAANIKK